MLESRKFSPQLEVMILGSQLIIIQLCAFYIFSFQHIVENITYIFPLFLLGQFAGSVLFTRIPSALLKALSSNSPLISAFSLIFLVLSENVVFSWIILFLGLLNLGLVITSFLSQVEGYKFYFYELAGAILGFIIFSLMTILDLGFLKMAIGSLALLAVASHLIARTKASFIGLMGVFFCLIMGVIANFNLTDNSGLPFIKSSDAKGTALYASTMLQSKKGRLIASTETRFGRVDLIESIFNPWNLAMSGEYIEPMRPSRNYYVQNVLFNEQNRHVSKAGDKDGYRGLQESRFFTKLFKSKDSNILIVGPAGGLELEAYEASQNVDVVEINKGFFNMNKQLPNALFNQFNVKYNDGRSFLRQTNKHYDLIHISNIISYYSLALGEVSIENHLLTVEAFSDMIKRLKKNGSLYINVFSEEYMSSKTRLIKNLLLAVHGELDVHLATIDQKDNMNTVLGLYPSIIVVKNGQFTKNEQDEFDNISQRLPLTTWKLVSKEEQRHILKDLSIRETNDDRPYFYNFESYEKIPKTVFLLLLMFVTLGVKHLLVSRIKKTFYETEKIIYLGVTYGLSQIYFVNFLNSFFIGIKNGFMFMTVLSLLGGGLGCKIYVHKKGIFKSIGILFLISSLSILFIDHLQVREKEIYILVLLLMIGQFICSSYLYCHILYKKAEMTRSNRGIFISINLLAIVFANVSAIYLSQIYGFRFVYSVIIYLILLVITPYPKCIYLAKEA